MTNIADNLSTRSDYLDFLRGIAVLGILLVNIYSFALPEAIRFNPHLLNNANSLDILCWYFINIFIDGKFISLLSLCFGASIYLFSQQHSQQELQKYRLFWLAILGSLHGYLLWSGDVLFAYGVMGFFAWRCRDWSDWRLLKMALKLTFILGLVTMLFGFLPAEYLADLGGPRSVDGIAEEVYSRQQSWWVQAPERIWDVLALQFAVMFNGWFLFAIMLVGIVIARRGWFARGISPSVCYQLLLMTLLPGVLLVVVTLYINIQRNFAADYFYIVGLQLHLWGSELMALGYAFLLLCLLRHGGFRTALRLLVPVGKMALSLYILQTLICTFLFYGYGAGLFAHFRLSQLVLIVVVIWVFQILVANIWLRYFYFGPLEYLWRRLSYRGPQPWCRAD